MERETWTYRLNYSYVKNNKDEAFNGESYLKGALKRVNVFRGIANRLGIGAG